jgi:hypothetical protein
MPDNQKAILAEALSQRLQGYIRKEDFKILLDTPLEEHGAGFDPHMTHEITRYLEKLLAQAVAHFKE